MKKKSRITAISLSIMMVFAMAPLTAVASIDGYQFELEADATNGYDVTVEEGNILTDKCGVGVTASSNSADVKVGDVQASTIGVKAWASHSGIIAINTGKITGDHYTECALGADIASGSANIEVDSIDVGMVRTDNNHRSAIEVPQGSSGNADILVKGDVNVTTEDTGAYLSGINVSGKTHLHVDGSVSMTNGEYALKAEDSVTMFDARTGDITATDTGKKGDYNYAAVNVGSHGGSTLFNMMDLKCLGDTFVGLRVRVEDRVGGKVILNGGKISVESKDGLYGGYGLDGYVKGDANSADVKVEDITAHGYGVNCTKSLAR